MPYIMSLQLNCDTSYGAIFPAISCCHIIFLFSRLPPKQPNFVFSLCFFIREETFGGARREREEKRKRKEKKKKTMKFERYYQTQQTHEWREHYVPYEDLKKFLFSSPLLSFFLFFSNLQSPSPPPPPPLSLSFSLPPLPLFLSPTLSLPPLPLSFY